MGCKCGKKGQISTTRGRPAVSAQRVTATRSHGSTPAQLQALMLKAAEQNGNNKPKNDFEKRRIEKLRREAIRRSLGKA